MQEPHPFITHILYYLGKKQKTAKLLYQSDTRKNIMAPLVNIINRQTKKDR